MTLTEFKSWFDPQLDAALCSQLIKYQQITDDDSLHYYLLHVHKLAIDGGKRARPYIAWLSYKSFGGKDDESIVPVLIAIEIFHLFCLVQDDITDKGATRHGVPTEHMIVADYLHKNQRLGDHAHAGDSMAMLVGDLLSAYANELLFTAPLEPTVHQAVLTEFQSTTNQVILGQMLDLDLMTRPEVDNATIATKHALKTSGYSFVSPLKIGAALAGQLEEHSKWCESLGYAVGAVFQLQDDILDITGLEHNAEKKTAGNDLRDGQHTFLTQYIWEHGTAEHKKILSRFFRQSIEPKDYPDIIRLFLDSGSLQAAREIVTERSEQARQTVAQTAISPPYHQKWLDLITYLEKRT